LLRQWLHLKTTNILLIIIISHNPFPFSFNSWEALKVGIAGCTGPVGMLDLMTLQPLSSALLKSFRPTFFIAL
jgi:hypothetical protein